MAMAKAVAKVFKYLRHKRLTVRRWQDASEQVAVLAHRASPSANRRTAVLQQCGRLELRSRCRCYRPNYDKIHSRSRQGWISGTGLTPAQLELIVDVWNQYGREPAHSLVERTHRSDTPWSRCYNGQRNAHISQEIMKGVFSRSDNRLKRSTREAIQRIPEIDKLPKEDYDPEEDAIWEAMLRKIERWDIWLAAGAVQEIEEKIRPVLILEHGESLCFYKMTTHKPREAFPNEYAIRDWKGAGLHKPTTIRGGRKIRPGTSRSQAKIGVLQAEDITNLLPFLELNPSHTWNRTTFLQQ